MFHITGNHYRISPQAFALTCLNTVVKKQLDKVKNTVAVTLLNEEHAQEAAAQRFGVPNHHSLQSRVVPEQHSQVVVLRLQLMTDSNENMTKY